MKRIWVLVTAIVLSFLPPLSFSAPFRVYPGARPEEIYDPKQSQIEAKIAKAPKVIIFITSDPFEIVVNFYRGVGREYRVPGSSGKPTKLPSGQELKEAYFIFDNAADIMTSKHWIKIQRPYLSRTQTREGFQGRYQAVREVTAIIEEDKRSYP